MAGRVSFPHRMTVKEEIRHKIRTRHLTLKVQVANKDFSLLLLFLISQYFRYVLFQIKGTKLKEINICRRQQDLRRISCHGKNHSHTGCEYL